MALLAILVHRSIGGVLHRGRTMDRRGDPAAVAFPSQSVPTVKAVNEPDRRPGEQSGLGNVDDLVTGLPPDSRAAIGGFPNSSLPIQKNERFPGKERDENIGFDNALETIPGTGVLSTNEDEIQPSPPLDQRAVEWNRRVGKEQFAGMAGSAETGNRSETTDENRSGKIRESAQHQASPPGRASTDENLIDEEMLSASRKEVARVQALFVMRMAVQLILLSVAMAKMKCGHLEFALSWVILFVLSQTWDIASILHDSKLSKGPQ